MVDHLRLPVHGVLIALCLCGFSPRAGAQVRSFAGIREILLEPALPGTEKAHEQLTAFLAKQGVFQPAPDASPGLRSDMRDVQARCTLKGDFKMPKPLGLECRDRRGQYVGTLRAEDLVDLQGKLAAYREEGAPGAQSLSEFWYIYVKPLKGAEWAADYAAGLLRANGQWRVIQSHDEISQDVRSRLLVCSVEPGGVVEDLDLTPRIYSYLTVSDSTGKTVRRFRAGSRAWLGIRPSVKAAVDGLIQRRREDEETHHPRAAATRQPH